MKLREFRRLGGACILIPLGSANAFDANTHTHTHTHTHTQGHLLLPSASMHGRGDNNLIRYVNKTSAKRSAVNYLACTKVKNGKYEYHGQTSSTCKFSH